MMHYSTTSLHCKNVPTAPPLSTFSLYSSSSSLSPSSSSSSPLPQHHLTSSFHVSRQSYPRAHPSPKQGMKVLCSKSEPIKVMISGAPASGKGTQCEMIVQKMVTARLSQQDAKEKGWLLDGFPRSFAQAQSLEKLNIRPDIYIVLDVPDEILIDRCVGRRLDPVTGKIYHIKNFPPETDEIKARLITRPDDTEQKVRSRLQIYKQNAEAILSTYMDTLNKIDGNRPKEVIFKDVDSLLSQVQKEKVKTTKPVKSTLQSKNQASSSQEIWRGIPTRLNNIPHSRDIRKYFYDDVLQGTKRAIEDGKTRLKVEISIPELNPEMDVYRIGTLMELVRVLALNFADDGKRIKVCVQGSMGEGALAGMPLQLAGSRKILEYMDWGDYGAMGTFINIGSIGGKEVSEEDDMFILVAPQNAVGNCIIDDLRAMTDAAGSRPVILVNPRLKDLPASSGIMQTIGRDKRLEYAASFENCYHFRLLYYAGTQYPIMGALRMSYPYGYELYKRVDDPSFGKEKYNILTTFPKRPNVDEINDTFEGKPRNQDKKASGFWGFLTGVFST
ncbi:adenylate kinase 5, chloroplastic isoform X4 [Rhododendron vialii]|uniref:adenylate kinase 5, chloroplastic isoform X4 n=1 Tax=Rhododendron vialii TaxID=182163 RepID=UPI00265FBFBB|nr:adenylate kinase 5, chloroplastic isoform X4 [Rhododendron vialii]